MKKRIILITLFVVMLLITGCENGLSVYSTFAGTDKYQIKINNTGTIDVFGQPDAMYDFSGWEGLKSVSVGFGNASGVTNDGTVYVTGFAENGACDVSGWRDIEMVVFTLYVAYGLKSDGTVVHTYSSFDEDVKRNSEVDKWTNIKQIEASMINVVGLKSDGTVVMSETDSAFVPSSYCKELASWKNIRWIDTSLFLTVGLNESGKIFYIKNNILSAEYYTEAFDELEGAKKICVGDTFISGLMPDGTIKVRYYIKGEEWWSSYDKNSNQLYEKIQERLPDGFKAINKATDIIDIKSYMDCLLVLKKDGTIVIVSAISAEKEDIKQTDTVHYNDIIS